MTWTGSTAGRVSPVRTGVCGCLPQAERGEVGPVLLDVVRALLEHP
ncbi:MAG: hypothetical protein L0H64_17250 [Pseudonocardia sp.]|nr:hypothetical protein [Pseudonocardia sp.]